MAIFVARLFIVLALSAVLGCIDPPKSPRVDVHDLVTSIDQSRSMAEQGTADDQYRLGLRYERAMPFNPREAVYWYRMAAEQHHADALYRLCFLSDIGLGLPQDFHEAKRWCLLAADQGHGRAMLIIGTYYDKAKAVSKDVIQAHRWYNLAAAYGQYEGRKFRDRLAYDMTPNQIAEAQLLARNWKPKYETPQD
jgi:TPR repeat protein